MFGVVFPQNLTIFTKQVNTMDKKVGTNFKIPLAILHCFFNLSIILLVHVYDHIFVPVANNLTENEGGINFLHKIGNIQLEPKNPYEIRRLRTYLQRIWLGIVLTLCSNIAIKILLEWWTLKKWMEWIWYFQKP